MRPLSTFILALLFLGCNLRNSTLTKKEFAEVYLDSLKKTYTNVKFELNSDLTITSKKGDLDYKCYVDNPYTAYTAEPDSIKKIIAQYVASTNDLYVDNGKISINNIVPVIKPIKYLDEINSLNKDGKEFPMITEKYNDQLIIAYGQDSKNSIKYLTEDDFKKLSISRDSLKVVALKNLDKILPSIQRQGDSGLYMISAGGDYEASLILLTSIWTKENFPVDGDFIIAIPNRDLLMVTGSKNKTGINKIKEIAEDSYKTGNYQVSDHLYKLTKGIFRQFD